MKLIFLCNYCQAEFEAKKLQKSIYYTVCPYCASVDTKITDHSKLLLDRKKKIDKLNESG